MALSVWQEYVYIRLSRSGLSNLDPPSELIPPPLQGLHCVIPRFQDPNTAAARPNTMGLEQRPLGSLALDTPRIHGISR